MVLLPDSLFPNDPPIAIEALDVPEDADRDDIPEDLEEGDLINLDDLRAQLRLATEADPDCALIREAFRNSGIPPFKTALSEWEDRDGILYFKKRIFLPGDLNLKQRIVKAHHFPRLMGHPGARKTLVLVKRLFWWPGMSHFVSEYVRGCAFCQQSKVNTHPTIPPTIPIEADKKANPFSTITMDFITGLPQSKGYDALLVIVDYDCSKGIILIPCTTTIGAVGTAKLIFEHVVRRFGLP